ncbi:MULTISPECIES: alkaline phosphatase [unclassified Janthinobacterium]|uniref:alkaline phosphatase D family protein n=1 Tax=unclassified Janthinobacterium TaxID=2610881 RepID=UPI00161565EB|nr:MULTISPECIES: alkaline phosphatase D family protein [unclassified Janthinobacterium]MBB5608463.1 alkaline phosphatase D [Janthinobacterium sp. S3T4]MBB5613984.1 alkaline phosphatase D [Janthinobacterium sp. S3M3]
MDSQRRIFLLSTARIAALAAAGGALSGSSASATTRLNGASYPFALGVASGSPLPDAVVLWTRICYDPLHAAATPAIALTVRWEMADDEAFQRIVARGSVPATPALAHSVHVDVGGLAPGRWYWYRFMLGDAVSPVGRTRTAPAPDSLPATLKLAVASCQHWEFGAYAAHRHIAAAAPDLVAFLGDYIYEWGPYQLQHPARAMRTNESFTLDEYRARYAQYKNDLDLQDAHAAAPWIVTWDDHEVSNDYANDRDELLTPNFLERRAAAYQAFYEHMPLRLLPLGRRGFVDMRIYQRYDWGRLARFHVLDDRQYRAHHACARPGRGGSNSVTTRNCPDLLKPERTMLGEEQQRWLQAGLDKSPARWNILAQQTLMAQSSQVPILRPGDERIWTDGWDGYPMARQHLLNSLQSSGARNPLVLSGDVHTFYATELSRDAMRPSTGDNPVIATEFCGTSITSSSRPQARTAEYVAMNPHIRYGRSDKRGYMLLNITPEKTTTLFLGLDNVRDSASNIATLASFTVHDGKAGLQDT